MPAFAEPLNIIYIHSHDTGRYIQPYGFAVPTPNLQKLAEQGVLFRQAFCASPTCSPSRASLLTGMAPHNNGMMGLAHFGFELNDYRQHILHALRGAGYYSALAGVQHIDRSFDPATAGARIGFDALLAHQDDPDGPRRSPAERAVDFLRQPPRQPFFLDVGFNETHREYPDPGVNPNYVRPPLPIPDTPATRRDMAEFITSAMLLDEEMGAVFAALDETGLAERTLVVCTTDHGLPGPGMKCNLTGHGTGVMLILRGPGPFGGGRAIDAPVSQLDLYPTLCEVAGAEKPAWLQGVSLLPLLEGRVESAREAVFAEVNFHVCYEPMRAVRTARYQYIRRFIDRAAPILPNTDDSPTKTEWIEAGWRERRVEQEQLYDLVFDPNEAHNLASDPSYQAVKAEMAARLDAWMRDTNDPLLRGPLPWPEGAPLLSPDATSPSELPFEKFV